MVNGRLDRKNGPVNGRMDRMSGRDGPRLCRDVQHRGRERRRGRRLRKHSRVRLGRGGEIGDVVRAAAGFEIHEVLRERGRLAVRALEVHLQRKRAPNSTGASPASGDNSVDSTPFMS